MRYTNTHTHRETDIDTWAYMEHAMANIRAMFLFLLPVATVAQSFAQLRWRLLEAKRFHDLHFYGNNFSHSFYSQHIFSLCVCTCVCARQQLKIFNYHGKKLSGNMHNISHMTRERERRGGYPENSVRLVYLEAAKHFLLFRSPEPPPLLCR